MNLPVLTVSEKALAKLRSIFTTNEEAGGKCLRLAVRGGGCSGFDYVFSFDHRREDDAVVSLFADVEIFIVIDPHSLPLVEGSEIDYEETLAGSQFRVKNPKATGVCGCGSSFSID